MVVPPETPPKRPVKKKEVCGSEGVAEELSEKEYDQQRAKEEKRWLYWLNQRQEEKERRARK